MTFSGVWPLVALAAVVVLPPLVVSVAWATIWVTRRDGFTGRRFAIAAASASLLLALIGTAVMLFWPTTPNPSPDNTLFSDAVGFRIFGGLAITLGGLAALVVTAVTWGIRELTRLAHRTRKNPCT